MFNNHVGCHFMCYTYTEEEREDAMLGLDLELVIWGYLILEYSLSFVLFLCKGDNMIRGRLSSQDKNPTNCPISLRPECLNFIDYFRG